MLRYILPVLLFAGLNISLSGSARNKDSTVLILPENRIYPVNFIDPLECQIMGGSYFLFQKDKDMSLYSTVNLGFNRPVFGKNGENISWEISFGTAIFSQFDLIRKDDGTYLAGLINNDFKLTGDLVISSGNNLFRIRTFHISSHLGDDYLERNSDTLLNDKSVNYEQADLTYLRKYGTSYWYAGAGYIYTIHVFRKRFSIQGGGLVNFREHKPLSYFTGVDIKSLAENDFAPDLRTAFGVSFNRNSEPLLRIWLEYYTGRVPYSTIEYGRINWIGAAMTLFFNK